MQLVKLQDQLDLHPATNVYSVIDEFFSKHSNDSAQKELWNLITGYLSQRVDEIPVAINQADTAYFCANISVLLNHLHALLRVGKQPTDETE